MSLTHVPTPVTQAKIVATVNAAVDVINNQSSAIAALQTAVAALQPQPAPTPAKQPPSILQFALSPAATSLVVPITALVALPVSPATIAGYGLSPANDATQCTWSSAPPTTFTFTSAGAQTGYLFVKDSNGLISSSVSASTVITLPVPVPNPTPTPGAPVDLGRSGEVIGGSNTPDFHGRSLFRGPGKWLQEFATNCRSYPVDPNSAHLISMIGVHNLETDFGAMQSTEDQVWGIPINVVADTQPLVSVIIDPAQGMVSGSDCTGTPCISMVPMPDNPAIEGIVEGTPLPTSDPGVDGGDHHCLIGVRNSTTGDIDTVWELYQVYKDPATGWHSIVSAKFDLTTGAPRKDDSCSADAAGLSIFLLLLRYDEAVINNCLNHALRFTLGSSGIRNRYVWPARCASYSGSNTDGIPFGARLRLTDTWYQANKANYTGAARTVLDCLYNFGMMMADVGGPLYMSAVSDTRWKATTVFDLNGVPSTAFEVCQLVPGYVVTGPTSIKLGQSGVYTVTHQPSYDSNFSFDHYCYEDGKMCPPTIQPCCVTLKDGVFTGTFTYTPTAAGTHTLSVDQSGSALLPDSNNDSITVVVA